MTLILPDGCYCHNEARFYARVVYLSDFGCATKSLSKFACSRSVWRQRRVANCKFVRISCVVDGADSLSHLQTCSYLLFDIILCELIIFVLIPLIDCLKREQNAQYGTRAFLNGFAAPGERIAIDLTGSVAGAYVVFADDDGEWGVMLNPHAPSTKPFTITISGAQGEIIVIQNATYGDVFLCAGDGKLGTRAVCGDLRFC